MPIRVRAAGLIVGPRGVVVERIARVDGPDWIVLVGGGVEHGEHAEAALRRECREELGIDVAVGERLGVLENIYETEGRTAHSIEFYFRAQPQRPGDALPEVIEAAEAGRAFGWWSPGSPETLLPVSAQPLVAQALGLKYWPIPMSKLENAALTLLPWSEVRSLRGVREDLVESCNDPAMARWTTVPHPYTTEQAEVFLGGVPEGVARWAYVVDGGYAGNVELRAKNGYPEAILGYSTAPWARGRGLTPQAVELVSAHAFARGLQRLELHVAAENAASRRGAEKAGYTYDGPLPEPVDQRGHLDELARYVRFAGDAAPPKSTSIAP